MLFYGTSIRNSNPVRPWCKVYNQSQCVFMQYTNMHSIYYIVLIITVADLGWDPKVPWIPPFGLDSIIITNFSSMIHVMTKSFFVTPLYRYRS